MFVADPERMERALEDPPISLDDAIGATEAALEESIVPGAAWLAARHPRHRDREPHGEHAAATNVERRTVHHVGQR